MQRTTGSGSGAETLAKIREFYAKPVEFAEDMRTWRALSALPLRMDESFGYQLSPAGLLEQKKMLIMLGEQP